MSHIATVKTELRDKVLLEQACKALGAEYLGFGTAEVFSVRRTGTVIKFPDWKFPIVIDAQGVVHFDNYNGAWGSLDRLHSLDQTYRKMVALAHLRRQGHRVVEQVTPQGDIVLVAQVD